MSTPRGFSFFANNVNSLSWSVTDSSGTVVNDATVVATLYFGRDRRVPELVPGTPCPDFTGINLAYDVATSKYDAQIPASFNPPSGGDYVLVIDVTAADTTKLAHYEVPSVVIEGGP